MHGIQLTSNRTFKVPGLDRQMISASTIAIHYECVIKNYLVCALDYTNLACYILTHYKGGYQPSKVVS